MAYLRITPINGAALEHPASAEVNRPLRMAGKSFLPQDAGYAVRIQVTAPSGEQAVDGVVNLGEQRPAGYADEITLGPLALAMLAVPDAGASREASAPAKLVPRDPGLWLSAEASGTALLKDRLLRPGETVEGGGWRVKLIELKRWNRFNVRMDGGLPVAIVGFALMVSGMGLRLADPDRLVRVKTGGGRAEVWTRARWGDTVAAGAQRKAVEALAAPSLGSEPPGETCGRERA